jgi:DNA-directed RNA polymerase specialized sigma subunit
MAKTTKTESLNQSSKKDTKNARVRAKSTVLNKKSERVGIANLDQGKISKTTVSTRKKIVGINFYVPAASATEIRKTFGISASEATRVLKHNML